MQTVLINTENVINYGISVVKIRGAFDMPGRFGTYKRDWKDVDGIETFVEVDDMYFKQRKISLDCVMIADSLGELQYNLGLFREIVYGNVTLTLPYSTHECVLKDGAKVKFFNSKYGPDVTAKFTLIFNEISYEFGSTLESDPNIQNNVFWIDNIDLKSFGIIVEESDGNFDFPKMKVDKITRYMRESDKVNKRDSRNIQLKCSLLADNITEFHTKITQFHSLLAQPELRKLMLPIEGLEQPYEVFAPDGFKLSELYQSSNSIVGKFKLILREAFPSPETFFLTVLWDTDGIAIITSDTPEGEYIYVIGDRTDTDNKKTYLFQPTEGTDNPYLWSDNEFDSDHGDYDENAIETYFFTDNEVE